MWMTLREGQREKEVGGSCHVMPLSLKGWMERGETVRQREMENSRIDAEENVTKQWNSLWGTKRHGEIRMKDFFWVCLCMPYIVEQWMSGASGDIFRAFCDLGQWKKRGAGMVVMKADNGGCRQQGTRWCTGITETHRKRDERRGEEWNWVRKEGVTLGGTTRKMAVLALSRMTQLKYN